MCKKKGIDPDDPWFEEVSQETWIWMYQSWITDLEEQHETYKNYATYLGAFSNPELAQKIANENKYITTDKEFEESWNNILADEEVEEKPLHRRRRVINAS